MGDWRKQKTKLEKMPMSKRVDRPGGKPFWPELEARLVSWVRCPSLPSKERHYFDGV